jgi:hypothetical protein
VTSTTLRRRASRDDLSPRITVHALGTASRNAGGVSRHPSYVYRFPKQPLNMPTRLHFWHLPFPTVCPIRAKMRETYRCTKQALNITTLLRFRTSHFPRFVPLWPKMFQLPLQIKIGGRWHTTRDRHLISSTRFTCRSSRVSVLALCTASRNAGVSRHHSTRIDPELQAPPSYRPCT